MSKCQNFLKVFPFLLLFLLSLEAHAKPAVQATPVESLDTTPDECSKRLFGTMESGRCEDVCKSAFQHCVLVTSYSSSVIGLPDDTNCYACVDESMCRDYGRIDAADCFVKCENNPLFECVAAPATPSGIPCFGCAPKPDRCPVKWPGTSWLAACQAGCKGKDEKCVLVGKHDGNDCYMCQKNPPPPQTCNDIGQLSNAQCNTCKPDENCVPSGVKTKSGEACFQCVPKNNPPPPPPDSCEAHGYNTPPCECGPHDYPINAKVGKKDCCMCLKDECSPNLNIWDCIECQKKGGTCNAMTKTRGQPTCYTCSMPKPPPKSCQDLGYDDSCDPDPCHEGEECVMVPVPKLNKECASCELTEHQPPDPCAQHQLLPDCSQCFRAQLACRHIPRGTPEDPYMCYECYVPEDPRTCEGYSMHSDCEYCWSQDMECANRPIHGLACYECIPKETVKGYCEAAQLLPGGCPGACSSEEICKDEQVFGLPCHSCEEKPYTQPPCPDGATRGDCSSGSCSSNEECVPEDNDCHRCQPKEVVPPPSQCDQGFEPGTCPGNCSSQQDCVQDGYCHQCKDKPVTTDDRCNDGYSPGKCYEITCSTAEICVENTKPGKKVCHQCRPKPQEKSCQNLEALDGACPANCSSNQDCVPVNAEGLACHQCKDKPKSTCSSPDYYKDSTCNNQCKSDEECSYVMVSSYNGGGLCWDCFKKRTETQVQCPEFSMLGSCSGPGGWSPCPGQICEEPAPGCHRCTLPPCDEGFQHGYCSPSTCPSGQECVTGSSGCYQCKEKPRTAPFNCAQEGFLADSGCNGQCKSDERCDFVFVSGMNGGGTCYRCVKKSATTTGGGETGGGTTIGGIPTGLGYTPGKAMTGSGYFYIPGTDTVIKVGDGFQTSRSACAQYELYSSCVSCRMQGDSCTYVSPEPGLRCAECGAKICDVQGYEDDCDACEWEGGVCTLVTVESPKSGRKALCYACVSPRDCAADGLACSCAECPQGTTCIPRPGPEGKPCYACAKAMGYDGEYVVLVVEFPNIRKVKDLAAVSSHFTPSSVMALMKAENPEQLEKIKKLVETMQGGIKGMATGSLQDIANQLQQMAKQGSFGQDCFGKAFSEAPLPSKSPSSGGGNPKKGETSAPAVGENEKDKAVVDGPVVACGKKDGKDALAVYDASGIEVSLITKDEISKNPQAVLNALNKASELTSHLKYLKNPDLKSIGQQMIQTLASKIFPTREQKEDKKKKGKETVSAIEPNDPLYAVNNDQKNKEKAKVMLGSGIKIGGVLLGDGVDDTLDKKEVVEYQWGLHKIGYLPKSNPDSAWNAVEVKGANVVVAIIDSGLDMTHPDGPEFIWTNGGETPDNNIDDDGNGLVDDVHGWNFLDNTNDLTDYLGHGTFVAGIIAAKTNNGIGIAGINPGAVIMPIKVTDKDGVTNSLHIFQGINYAVNHGAQIISISLGDRGVSELEQSAINNARANGVFVAIAAGNEKENIDDYGPASSLGAFAVGSLDQDGRKSTVSNWGPNNGIIAPGDQIFSLRSKESFKPKKDSSSTEFYYVQSGTSFATPMVAATASLLLVKNPNLTPDQIESILQASAQDVYDRGWDSESGAGILNAAKALRQTPDGLTTVKINRVEVHRNNKKVESIDVYATARGDISEFTVGLGRGKNAGSFKPVAGPFNKEVNNEWVAHLDGDLLNGSDEWVIQVEAKNKNGKTETAQNYVMLGKPRNAVLDY